MFIGSLLILKKKFTSRGPVHPIPAPINLQSFQNNRNDVANSQPTNQESMELQPIRSISGNIDTHLNDSVTSAIPRNLSETNPLQVLPNQLTL